MIKIFIANDIVRYKEYGITLWETDNLDKNYDNLVAPVSKTVSS